MPDYLFRINHPTYGQLNYTYINTTCLFINKSTNTNQWQSFSFYHSQKQNFTRDCSIFIQNSTQQLMELQQKKTQYDLIQVSK